ncbi:MAG TPA: GNAT family N-acetyltransferase [Solirubrobacteraceae bacterium]|nr:GNAT family N-acetyltransferase [Solirubrobacteraceae bacterium]
MHTAALVLADGARLGVRPIGADDREALSVWFGRLSPESRRRRFLGPKPRLSGRELTYLTDVDHVSHTALVAVDETGRLVGEARYATDTPGGRTADFAVTVADEWQGRGVGSRLAAQLVDRARANGIARLTALTLWENTAAISLLHRLGFLRAGYDGDALEYELAL